MRARGLRLVRGGRVLIEALSFSARGGDYLEITGANGAGKTSLLRALAGFLRPEAGTIEFPGAPEPALGLHFIGHQNGLKPNASVASHLSYWAGLFGGRPNQEILAKLGLARAGELATRVLSQGQKQRLALARLLVAPRPLWLLDEPAAALDAEARAVLAAMIESQCASGGTVLAAVHEPLGPSPSQILELGAP